MVLLAVALLELALPTFELPVPDVLLSIVMLQPVALHSVAMLVSVVRRTPRYWSHECCPLPRSGVVQKRRLLRTRMPPRTRVFWMWRR